jgi:uncharacterized protein (TIGR02271 family)
MTYEKIVTLFDSAPHADVARRNLESAGFPSSEISVMSSKTPEMSFDRLPDAAWWRRLFGHDIDDREATAYGTALERGGVVLTVRVPETDVEKAMEILNAHDCVDMQRNADGDDRSKDSPPAIASAPARPATMAARSAIGSEEVIRLAEEQFNVGKRVVRSGTTRVRRFVTEKPVEAIISLHEEHAAIIRRAAADPSFAQDIDWSDKIIEVSETVEEPVITKSVQITEEVVIRKESKDSVRTFRDKIRRQEIKVEQTPPGQAGSGH